MKVSITVGTISAVIVALSWVSVRWFEDGVRARAAAMTSGGAFMVGSSAQDPARSRDMEQLESSHDVSRSILDGLKLAVTVQSEWSQRTEFMFQVDLEKPLGKRYVVDRLEQSCVLYIDNRPWALLLQGEKKKDPRTNGTSWEPNAKP